MKPIHLAGLLAALFALVWSAGWLVLGLLAGIPWYLVVFHGAVAGSACVMMVFWTRRILAARKAKE